MPQKKKIKEKKVKAVENDTEKEVEEVIEKPKKELDLESSELLIPDKTVDDDESFEGEESDDESGDGSDFDDEELNPFKDKWEE